MLRPCSLCCIASVRRHFGRTQIGVTTFVLPKPLQNSVTTRYTVILFAAPATAMQTCEQTCMWHPHVNTFFPSMSHRQEGDAASHRHAVKTAMPLRHGSARTAKSYVQGREHLDLARRFSNCKDVESWLFSRPHAHAQARLSPDWFLCCGISHRAHPETLCVAPLL